MNLTELNPNPLSSVDLMAAEVTRGSEDRPR